MSPARLSPAFAVAPGAGEAMTSAGETFAS